MIDLTGKVILVTGGSSGIGAVTVRTLANAGAMVILHYFSQRDKAEENVCYVTQLTNQPQRRRERRGKRKEEIGN